MAFAQSSDNQIAPPGTSLDETLTTECFSHVDRRATLGPFRAGSTNPGVYWQSGYVYEGGKWLPFEDAVEHARHDPAQREYERLAESRRNKHARLAKWSLRNHRVDQYRTHMLAAARGTVLPDRTLKAMGYQEVGGQLMSPESAYSLYKNQHTVLESLQDHGAQVLLIRKAFEGGLGDQEQAEAELKSITSPDVVDAVFQILGHGNAICQRQAAHTLARINSVRSTLLLANAAVFSPLESVRNVSIAALRDRPKEAFVPPLIDLLTSVRTSTALDTPTRQSPYGLSPVDPFKLTSRINFEKRARVVSHISSLGYDFEQIPVPDPEMGSNPDFRFGGSMMLYPGANKLQTIQRDVAHWRLLAARQSVEAKESVRALNKKVTTTLNAVLDQQSDKPEFWWAWWDKYSDIDAPVKEVLEVENNVQQRRVTFRVAASCFAAGTPVLTELGFRPIESIQIGERVLSQDIDTGELRFRVVQKTTIRPPRKTHIINFNNESIRCTGGHNFWKAGTGWVKARDLEVGDRIRTPTGTEAVTAVATSEPARTHNLVVEGFHTYFVGDLKLLVQDVLPITPTDNVLPGLSRFELGDKAAEDTDLVGSQR
ncbi:MAG: polymorphic toxin-type HINT domain-containing protein [Planctomycetaceae bacterium]